MDEIQRMRGIFIWEKVLTEDGRKDLSDMYWLCCTAVRQGV